jgi:hypothetical protein
VQFYKAVGRSGPDVVLENFGYASSKPSEEEVVAGEIFDLSGKRLRQFPMTPESVRAVLGAG